MRKQTTQPTSSDRRGQSELVGIVLLFGMVIAAAGIVFVAGSSVIDSAEDTTRVESAETSMETVNDELRSMSDASGNTSSTIPVSDNEVSDISVEDDASFTLTAQYASGTESHTISDVGSVTYTYEDGTKIASEAGGVWRMDSGDEDAVSVVTPPPLSYDDETRQVSFEVVKANTTGASDTVDLTAIKDAEASQKATQEVYEDLFRNDEMPRMLTIDIQNSQYQDAWYSFLKRNYGSMDGVVVTNGGSSVQVKFGVGSQEAIEIEEPVSDKDVETRVGYGESPDRHVFSYTLDDSDLPAATSWEDEGDIDKITVDYDGPVNVSALDDIDDDHVRVQLQRKGEEDTAVPIAVDSLDADNSSGTVEIELNWNDVAYPTPEDGARLIFAFGAGEDGSITNPPKGDDAVEVNIETNPTATFTTSLDLEEAPETEPLTVNGGTVELNTDGATLDHVGTAVEESVVYDPPEIDPIVPVEDGSDRLELNATAAQVEHLGTGFEEQVDNEMEDPDPITVASNDGSVQLNATDGNITHLGTAFEREVDRDSVSDRDPLDVVIVSDESSSMNRNDAPPSEDPARPDATDLFIDRLEEQDQYDDRVATVHFSLWGGDNSCRYGDSDAQVQSGFASPENVDATTQSGDYRCGTNYHAGMKQAMELLENRDEDRKSESKPVIVFMGDGKHTADRYAGPPWNRYPVYYSGVDAYEYDVYPTESAVRSEADEAHDRGYEIHTIGFSVNRYSDEDAYDLLNYIKSEDGLYRAPQDPEDLEGAYEEILEETTEVEEKRAIDHFPLSATLEADGQTYTATENGFLPGDLPATADMIRPLYSPQLGDTLGTVDLPDNATSGNQSTTIDFSVRNHGCADSVTNLETTPRTSNDGENEFVHRYCNATDPNTPVDEYSIGDDDVQVLADGDSLPDVDYGWWNDRTLADVVPDEDLNGNTLDLDEDERLIVVTPDVSDDEYSVESAYVAFKLTVDGQTRGDERYIDHHALSMAVDVDGETYSPGNGDEFQSGLPAVTSDRMEPLYNPKESLGTQSIPASVFEDVEEDDEPVEFGLRVQNHGCKDNRDGFETIDRTSNGPPAGSESREYQHRLCKPVNPSQASQIWEPGDDAYHVLSDGDTLSGDLNVNHAWWQEQHNETLEAVLADDLDGNKLDLEDDERVIVVTPDVDDETVAASFVAFKLTVESAEADDQQFIDHHPLSTVAELSGESGTTVTPWDDDHSDANRSLSVPTDSMNAVDIYDDNSFDNETVELTLELGYHDHNGFADENVKEQNNFTHRLLQAESVDQTWDASSSEYHILTEGQDVSDLPASVQDDEDWQTDFQSAAQSAGYFNSTGQVPADAALIVVTPDEGDLEWQYDESNAAVNETNESAPYVAFGVEAEDPINEEVDPDLGFDDTDAESLVSIKVSQVEIEL